MASSIQNKVMRLWGSIFYAPQDYREYIQASLTTPLKEGVTYTFSFYVSLAEGSDYAVKDFGVVFTDKPLALNTKQAISKGDLYRAKVKFHSVNFTAKEFYQDTKNWTKISIDFIAKGYERFLSLGNFKQNKDTFTKRIKRTTKK